MIGDQSNYPPEIRQAILRFRAFTWLVEQELWHYRLENAALIWQDAQVEYSKAWGLILKQDTNNDNR